LDPIRDLYIAAVNDELHMLPPYFTLNYL